MAEDQRFRSLKFYNNKRNKIISPDVELEEVDNQQQIEQIE